MFVKVKVSCTSKVPSPLYSRFSMQFVMRSLPYCTVGKVGFAMEREGEGVEGPRAPQTEQIGL